jgi:endonuclease G
VRRDSTGALSIFIPAATDVHAVVPAIAPAPLVAPQGPLVLEKVVINQSNYAKRNGYDPKFLGAAAVPLPKVASDKAGKVFVLPGKGAELKYWNYSVVLNQTRALAYFSAANVDAANFRGNRDAAGDTWFRDTRVDAVDKAAQTGNEFYKKQSTFEADRTLNPFDQGHLTRRSDLQWGPSDATAKRNGDDSYHFTNCTPQHWQFNQNNRATAATGIWFRLEDAAIASLAEGAKRLCVINGPVFDAPLCKAGTDGRLHLDLNGKPVPDETFGGVKIPKQFFKVIAYVSGQALKAKAFVVTQEDLLAGIKRLRPEEATLTALEIRLYQVRIAELERLTGLDFGPLSQHDAQPGQESLVLDEGLPIAGTAELRF